MRRNGEAVEVESIGNVASLASFGEARDGELYLVSLNGTLHRQQAADPGAAEPMATALSETGIFTDVASLTIVPGFIEYSLIVPFWSDGADKRRWLGGPEDRGIDFDATEPWAFPVGTVLVKHFEIRLDEADPASLRRLETRLLIHRAAGWEGFTYRWNEAGTDATLLADRELEALTVETSEGPMTFSYTYPSRTDCLRCHLPQAGSVLGLKTRQMNRDFPFPLATDNQLRTYDHIEPVATRIGEVAQYAAFPRLDDSSQPLEERARTYLDVNCAQCHRPHGGTTVALDLRFDTPLAGTNTVGVVPQAGTLGLDDARIIEIDIPLAHPDKARIAEARRAGRLSNHGDSVLPVSLAQTNSFDLTTKTALKLRDLPACG